MTLEKDSFVLGIDLGGTNIKGAILSLEGEVIIKNEIPTLAKGGPEAVADRIVYMARQLQGEAGLPKRKLIGAGLGVPGQIDCAEGCVLCSGNLDWQEVRLVAMVAKNLEMPVFIENDATAAALGEKWRGAGKDARNCVMLTIGTGIGGGIVLGDSVYRGVSGYAAEIGHMVILADGPECSCGNKGCLEALASAKAMLKKAREAISNGERSLLANYQDFGVKEIFCAAANGDALSLRIIDSAAYYLGIGIGNLINIFNPEVIIVGGGVSGAGEALFSPLRKYAMQNSLIAPRSVVQIVSAQLGNDAGFIGAGAVALQALGHKFSPPDTY